MGKYLILFLLLLSPKSSYAQQCTYVPTAQGYISNLQCTGIDPSTALRMYWCPSNPQDPMCPPLVICSPSSMVEERPCPSNFSGSTTWRRDTACPSSAWGSPVTTGWYQVANSCTPSPPTCSPSSQTQSLSCPSGYVGAVMQNRTSICPDPYGQPIWSPWVTTTDMCVKSATNPTNMGSVLNPVSPISPLNPSQQSSKSMATSLTLDMLLMMELLKSEEDSSNEEAIQESTQTQLARPAARGKILIPGLGMALSLSTFVNKVIKQENVFPATSINQPVPEDYKNSGQFFMDIYGISLPDQSSKFDALKQDAVELEQ